ncbi:uncharacterized protein LOC144453003 [Glandiceps talaboti]
MGLVWISKRSKCGCVSSTSSSIDSSHTRQPLFKLPPISSPTCPFGGSAQASGSGSSVRGPSTRTWDATHYKLLNFNLHRGRNTVAEYVARSLSATELQVTIQRVLEILFYPTPALHKPFELDPPRIIQDGVIEMSTMRNWIENDEILQYALDLLQECEEDFNLHTASIEEYTALKHYIYNDFKVKEKTTLTEDVIVGIKKLVLDIFKCCAERESREEVFDHLIYDMMSLIIMGETCRLDYRISLYGATKRQFEICGSQVTSFSNVLLAYEPNLHQYPVMLSENKSGLPEKKSTASSRPYKKPHMEHKKISQVIGHAVSVADESVFETDDYKIVYHISLKGLGKLIITRTHVAKNTLKKIKEGCLVKKKVVPSPSNVEPSPLKVAPSSSDVEPSPLKVAPSSSDVEPPHSKIAPSSSDVEPPPSDVEPCHIYAELSPSHVVESTIHLDSHPVHLFVYLYIPILILVKLCNFIHEPTVKDVPKKQTRKSKPILKRPSKRKQYESTPTKKRKKT